MNVVIDHQALEKNMSSRYPKQLRNIFSRFHNLTEPRVGPVSWKPWAPGCLTNRPHCASVLTFAKEGGLCYPQLLKSSSGLSDLSRDTRLHCHRKSKHHRAQEQQILVPLESTQITLKGQVPPREGPCPHFSHLLMKNSKEVVVSIRFSFYLPL